MRTRKRKRGEVYEVRRIGGNKINNNYTPMKKGERRRDVRNEKNKIKKEEDRREQRKKRTIKITKERKNS